MRVERARSEESDIGKPEAKARNVQPQTSSSISTTKLAEGANQGAFSKVLDVARQTSESGRTEKQTGDSEGETFVDKPGEGKKEATVEGKGAQRDDQRNFSGENDGGENPAWMPAPLLVSDRASETNTAVPQARAILHIADLERIVSGVRSNSFADSKQVTIDLKNSVLDGLRVQLTLTEQGNLKAEFLALNEQIKKQLEARKNELQSILKDRSIKCSELKITVVEQGNEGIRVDRSDGPA
jgi:hypothetical protein